MRFEEAYLGWTNGRLLGQCERSFRRHIERYEADGLDGLLDKRSPTSPCANFEDISSAIPRSSGGKLPAAASNQ